MPTWLRQGRAHSRRDWQCSGLGARRFSRWAQKWHCTVISLRHSQLLSSSFATGSRTTGSYSFIGFLLKRTREQVWCYSPETQERLWNQVPVGRRSSLLFWDRNFSTSVCGKHSLERGTENVGFWVILQTSPLGQRKSPLASHHSKSWEKKLPTHCLNGSIREYTWPLGK